jgi:preprotein translocase subunit YajC
MDLLILIVILGVLYTLFMLPARRRRVQHAAMQDSIVEGDEIVTAGGLHGHVRSFDDEANTVRVEIAPNTVVTLDRRAVAAVAHDVEVEVEPEPEPVENAPETGEQPR